MSIILGIIGLVLISVAVWIKNEKRQDVVFIVGGLCLLIYSISIKNLIFSVLQIVFVAATFMELTKLG